MVMVWRKFLCNFFVCHPLFLTCSSLLCSARSVNILSNFIALFTYNVLCGNKRRNRNSNKSEQRETEPCTRMVKTVSMWNNVNNISYTFYSQQKKKEKKKCEHILLQIGPKAQYLRSSLTLSSAYARHFQLFGAIYKRSITHFSTIIKKTLIPLDHFLHRYNDVDDYDFLYVGTLKNVLK